MCLHLLEHIAWRESNQGLKFMGKYRNLNYRKMRIFY